MEKGNPSTPIYRRLTLTQAVWGKPISTGLVLVTGIKPESLDVFFTFPSVISPLGNTKLVRSIQMSSRLKKRAAVRSVFAQYSDSANRSAM